MNPGVGFGFLYPAVLLLLPLAWGLAWLVARRLRARSAWARACDAPLFAYLATGAGSAGGHRRTFWLLAAVLTLGVVGAAGPSWRLQSHPLLTSFAARVLVLDLSQSMRVEDVKPNRHAQTIEAARAVVGAEFDGETGLVAFAGAAFVVSPLTSDARTLDAFLEALSPATMPLDGSRADLGIEAAADLLDASVAGRGQILLLSDGVDEAELAVRAALAASERGHRVSVLAIGTAEGGPLRDRAGGLVRDAQGGYRLSRTDFASLERIAQIGNGAYQALTAGADVFGRAVSAFDHDELVELVDDPAADWRPRANDGVMLVWLALPLALLLFRRNLLWVLLLAVVAPYDRAALASDGAGIWRHAEELAHAAYLRGDLEEALALSSAPMLRGAVHFRERRYALALEEFSRATGADAWYNRGNAEAQLKRFPEAVHAYTRALELAPGHDAARFNRRLLQAYLERAAAAAGASPEAADGEDAAETGELGTAQPRIGIAGQSSQNPADDDQTDAGFGASQGTSPLDFVESYDGTDPTLEQFLLRADESLDARGAEAIENWLEALPDSSSDLFRRKFLRDYQRQIRQER